MKILKIRENKLKLSLSSEEAAAYGIVGHAQGSNDLRAAVERIFFDRRELFRIEEKIIVEAYPKIDGSFDVFVTNLPPTAPKAAVASHNVALWGFSATEQLALALYVLLREHERLGSAPLCEREEEDCEAPLNELCESDCSRPLCECFREEVFGLNDLVLYLKEKTGNDRIDKLKESMRGACIYRCERKAGEGGCAYILALEENEAEGSIRTMCELALPIDQLGTEVLGEHASVLAIDALLSMD